jgi:hypothetical protein
MLHPAASAIWVSASMKGRSSRSASLRPIHVLPAPIMPVSTMVFAGMKEEFGEVIFW